MIKMWPKACPVPVQIRKPTGSALIVTKKLQRDSIVASAKIRRLTGCAKISNTMLLKVLIVRSVTVKRPIGIALTATITPQLE